MGACLNGNETLVKYLVEHGADVNYEGYSGQTSLLIACEKCEIREEERNAYMNIIKYLIEHGADINHINKYGYTL